MRHDQLPARAAGAALTIVIAGVVGGCTSGERSGHGSVGRSPDFVTLGPTVPDLVSYAAGAGLEGVADVGITTSFAPNPDWLVIEGGGVVTVDMTDLDCSLLLEQGSSTDLGVDFTGEDAADTVSTLVARVGAHPESSLTLLWTGNDGTISVDALIFVVVTAEGERVLALARAFGSLDAFVYAQLTCNPGVSTEAVFSEKVAPYLSVTLE